MISWPDGTTREGWLRAGDAMDYTAAVATEIAVRLAHGDAPPGAYTPAAAFGPLIAASVGAELILDWGRAIIGAKSAFLQSGRPDLNRGPHRPE